MPSDTKDRTKAKVSRKEKQEIGGVEIGGVEIGGVEIGGVEILAANLLAINTYEPIIRLGNVRPSKYQSPAK